jgi:uncharacterized protein with NRDE domain
MNPEYGTRTRIVVRPDTHGTWETVLEQRYYPTSYYLSRASYESALDTAITYSRVCGMPFTVILEA